jgi:hypothetical protein
MIGVSVVLPTNEADPLRRLRLVKERMLSVRAEHPLVSAELLTDSIRYTASATAAVGARLVFRNRLVDYVSPAFNLAIVNAPGPQHPLYLAGARQVAGYAMSSLSDGLGLTVTALSYDGQMHLALLACPELVPDLWTLLQHQLDDLAELQKAASLSTVE